MPLISNYRIKRIVLPSGDTCKVLGTTEFLEAQQADYNVRDFTVISTFLEDSGDLVKGTRIAVYFSGIPNLTIPSQISSIPGDSSGTTLTLTFNDNSSTNALPIYKNSDTLFTDDIPAGSIVLLTYYPNYWDEINQTTVNAWVMDIGSEGTESNLPNVTTADNGKFLQVVNGQWTAIIIEQATGGNF